MHCLAEWVTGKGLAAMDGMMSFCLGTIAQKMSTIAQKMSELKPKPGNTWGSQLFASGSRTLRPFYTASSPQAEGGWGSVT